LCSLGADFGLRVAQGFHQPGQQVLFFLIGQFDQGDAAHAGVNALQAGLQGRGEGGGVFERGHGVA